MSQKEIQRKIKYKLKIGLGLISLTTIGYITHRCLTKNYPEMTRKIYFDKLFNYNMDSVSSSNINLFYMLSLYRVMLKLNLIPKADIKIANPEILVTGLLGHKFKYPIGLAPGIDNNGGCISNLNDLGFEFIEIGPVTNESESNSSKSEIILNNKTLLLKNIEGGYPIDISNSNIQTEIFKILNQKTDSKNIRPSNNYITPANDLIISTNIKLSDNSIRTVPYMSDSIFIKLIKTSLLLSDFTTINLSSYTNKAILQYKNPIKFELFINKVKEEVLFDAGVKAVIDHEIINKPKENANVTSTLNLAYPVLVFKNTIGKILLRLDTKLSDEELENYVKIVKKSGIIDGIVIGGMIQKDKASFISGELSKESNLELLKRCYGFTKGEVPLISTGGVLNGEDVFERLRHGADFVLIYSPFLINGPYCMEKIVSELEKKMVVEGKRNIKEIRNNH